MAEYINREELKCRFQKRLDWLEKDVHDEYSGALLDSCEYDMKLIDEIPFADVVPVRIGFWEIGGINPANNVIGNFKCSLCKGTSLEDSDYCPNCGAKMEGIKYD